jgi:hypothetical protein
MSTSRFKTVPKHHKTQGELDAEMFPKFTSLVGTELTDKEEINKIEKKYAQPKPTEHSIHGGEKDQSTHSEDLLLPVSPTEQTPSPSATSSTTTTSTSWE